MSHVDTYTLEKRKDEGIYYTPEFLSLYLARKIIYYLNLDGYNEKQLNIIDPACGDSALLHNFLRMTEGTNLDQLNIYGIDKDINAIISSTNSFSTVFEKSLNRYSFFNCDGLFPKNSGNADSSWKQFKEEINLNQGFDIALSNPPWGSDMSGYDFFSLQTSFSTATGQFDIYNLFVESILGNLKDGGYYGFILPDSLFSQEQWRLRSILLKETSIKQIARLGEKIFDEINRACVLIIGKKEKPTSKHQIDCFRLNADYRKQVLQNGLALEEADIELSHKVPQQRFTNNTNFLFDIDLTIGEENILAKIEKSKLKLKTYVTNTRGAEISKKGIACQCSNCKNWLPFPKATIPKCPHCKTNLILDEILTEKIILNHNGYGNVRLKVGEDLFRYTSKSKSWINTLKEGINYKSLDIYQGDKILVRKTGVGITASLDYENSITNQVVYILKLKENFENKISLEFILAVLNSRAMTYYLIKKYGENEWRTHPYLTQSMLINLPFPKIDFRNKEQINLIEQVTQLIKKEINELEKKNISKESDLIIEKIIAQFFGLSKIDYQVIFETLDSAQQLIPIKRLLNCNYHEVFNLDGI